MPCLKDCAAVPEHKRYRRPAHVTPGDGQQGKTFAALLPSHSQARRRAAGRGGWRGLRQAVLQSKSYPATLLLLTAPQVRRAAAGRGRALRQAAGCGALLGASTQPSTFAACKSLAPQLLGSPIELFWTVSDIGNGGMLLSGAVDALLPLRMGYFAFGICAPSGGMVGGSALIFKQNTSSATRARSLLCLAALPALCICKMHSVPICLQTIANDIFSPAQPLSYRLLPAGLCRKTAPTMCPLAQGRLLTTHTWKATALGISWRARASWTLRTQQPATTIPQAASRQAPLSILHSGTLACLQASTPSPSHQTMQSGGRCHCTMMSWTDMFH